MSTIDALLDDNDIFNIADASDAISFHELQPFVAKLAPDYVHVVDKVIAGKDVRTKEMTEIIRALSDVLMPYYNRDGISDPEMAKLDAILLRVGLQL